MKEFGKPAAPRKAFGEALAELGRENPDLLVLDSDVGTSTQAAIFQKAFPDRYIEVGIAEANMMGIAAGLATLGFVPFVSTFAVFVSKRALDQISISIAYPGLNVKLNGSYGGIPTGRAGATHQSVEDIAIMRAMPNMKILVPAAGPETRLAVRLAVATPGPVYLRTARCEVPTIFGPDHSLEWGKSVQLADGLDVAIVATGMMTHKAVLAAERLAKTGVKARVIHMPSIKPIDEDALIRASKEIGKIVTVENHSVIGGLGGAVAEVVTRRAPCRVIRLGFPDCFGESGDDEAIFAKFGCNVEQIEEQARRMAAGLE